MVTAEHPPFLGLPSELIHHILSYLPLSDLISISSVNREFHEHSLQDTLWRSLIQENVHGVKLTHPKDSTWRDIFKTHHPYWFIPKNKIWFADNVHTGKLLIARYDPNTNAIEGFALGAERRHPTFTTWDWNPEAIIHTFSPRIQLDRTVPILRLDANAYAHAVGETPHRLQKEVPMGLFKPPAHTAPGIFCHLMLTRPWPAQIIGRNTPVWPPLRIPSSVRTRNDSPSQFRGNDHRPTKIQELSDKTFRIRKWMEFSSRTSGISMRVGEDVATWATLPEECYTPTAQKPWQGIWCGDYAGHGCEFLAIIQPDNPDPLPERAEWAMRARERTGSVSSSESWITAPMEAAGSDDESDAIVASPTTSVELEDSVATLLPASPESQNSMDLENEVTYQGRIEAIKLTGDPNIPRGEYTFIAPDIGPQGLVRVATEDMFKGARIVKSVGHIAGRGFRDDDFIASQLILISHDRLAQYWETFGHVSFYQRVNLEELTKVS